MRPVIKDKLYSFFFFWNCIYQAVNRLFQSINSLLSMSMMACLCIMYAGRTVNKPFCTNQTCWTHSFPRMVQNQSTNTIHLLFYEFWNQSKNNEYMNSIHEKIYIYIYTTFIWVSGLKLWFPWWLLNFIFYLFIYFFFLLGASPWAHSFNQSLSWQYNTCILLLFLLGSGEVDRYTLWFLILMSTLSLI